ncbi:metalloprotease PmbA [Nevskia ramosa]|uniref:metalloprotease PmbA n=1 Tax=Nevskia ramosa TaxID=64002 RepID=UPI0003B577D1|nr:metalloprotease PmbA [Nevskia ramosa]
MTATPPARIQGLPEARDLEPRLHAALALAQSLGASAAESYLGVSRGLSVAVRQGEVESVQFQRDRDLSVTVFFGHRTGSASTTDLSDAALKRTVEAACAIARVGGEDPCIGLADPSRMAREFPDLDLYHPAIVEPEAAIDLARECEAAAFAADARITQSEGASVDTRESLSLYANTHGFLGCRRATDYSLGCAAIAVDGDAMQVGHWYSATRRYADLDAAAAIGKRAGERAAARLGGRSVSTQTAPVLFPAEVARGLFGHFIGAISGASLYRRASFLHGKLGEAVFASRVSARQMPWLLRGASSSAYDQEGVATTERQLIDHGVLGGYLLGSYSARKLGMESTGNAGGIYNLIVDSTFDGGLEALAREMGHGLIATDLMGQGVNTVTGDYSRAASGFWVENGVIAYPVDEITIAGNLATMYRGIAAIGSDVDTRGGVRCGSVLIDAMTVAGGA